MDGLDRTRRWQRRRARRGLAEQKGGAVDAKSTLRPEVRGSAKHSSALASRPPPSRVSASSSGTVPLARSLARKFDYTSEACEAYRAFGCACTLTLSPALLRPRAAASSISSSPPLGLWCFARPSMICPRFPASTRAPFTPSFLLPYISIRSYSPHILLDPSAISFSPPPAPLTPHHMPLYTPASFQSNPDRDARTPRYLLTKPRMYPRRSAINTLLFARVDNPRCAAAVERGACSWSSFPSTRTCAFSDICEGDSGHGGGHDRTSGSQACKTKWGKKMDETASGGSTRTQKDTEWLRHGHRWTQKARSQSIR
ncbi:hypothetical protein C8R44DRAFT_911471 [Mycena epipterygia]|nr:hypothetical protein C8R44DRAFT_911471 [Mycena epipterygia]